MRTVTLAAVALTAIIAAFLTGCPEPTPELAFSASTHHFYGDPYTGNFERQWTFTIWNGGDQGVNLYFELTCDQNWISIEPKEGLSAGQDKPVTITITVNRDFSAWLKTTQPFATAQINIASTGGDATVTVTTAPNFYTEVFNEFTRREIDLNNTAFTYKPDASLNYYGVRMTEDVTEFPISPEHSMLLDFGVADPYEIVLPTGWLLPFYGKQYSRIFVSSTGYIAFGDPGHTPETMGAHFLSPQISALPVDAVASPNAMVSFGLDTEKACITFEQTPSSAAAPDSSNDFQLELYFDETIRLSYPNVDTDNTEGVVGFSPGGGDGVHPLEEDFVISDLTDATTAPLATALTGW